MCLPYLLQTRLYYRLMRLVVSVGIRRSGAKGLGSPGKNAGPDVVFQFFAVDVVDFGQVVHYLVQDLLFRFSYGDVFAVHPYRTGSSRHEVVATRVHLWHDHLLLV
jgi:hypothetical protein